MRMADRVQFEKKIRLVKQDDEQGLLYGVVYEPDVVDAQGDKASADEIEKACHSFLLNRGVIKLEHEGKPQPVYPVESYVAQTSFKLGGERIKKGAWVLVTKTDDPAIRQAIKDGEITGYSMAGEADKLKDGASDDEPEPEEDEA
jgi:hypothetical protein